MRNMIIVITVIALGALGAFLVLSQNGTTVNVVQTVSPTPAPPAASPSATASRSAAATEETAPVITFDMEAGSYYFKPERLTVKKGQTVRIVLKSVSMMHDFNIDELNVHSKTVPSGETATVEFKADKTGSFEYYCAIGNHRQLGQVGTLTVQ